MGKFIKVLAGIVLALSMALSGNLMSTNVLAANDAALYISGARFLTALHGQADDNSEIVIALYEKNGEDIAYINDGMSHVYTSYTVSDATIKGIGQVQRYAVEGTLVFNFFMAGDIPCIMLDDGKVFACEYLDSYAVSQLQSYD
ncbi:hypothetical protein SAMN04487928_10539 [Butyrivibrio proteoclasticus]|uniref:Uncharacterized protein n=1 Tax=Butyrivibrio proteoclasticus TaxID=43305 RepID=A0A1I5RZ96_9FIRM|nr:hypothetical protein [Butyrivibrio proteoclasticus]SFP63780.1 hypothetical protein SAMN04487928_10539 [Butyrivibrio proteoclasticus]